LEAVEAVCNTRSDLGLNLLDGMASMVDKSLLQQVEEAQREPRFMMLETIREYGLEKLQASEEDALTRRAPLPIAWCWRRRDLLRTLTPRVESGWIVFEVEHDNFRVALDG